MKFSIPLDMIGTDFQMRVWKVLLEIPYGATRSYAGQAKALGNAKAVRAVAKANGDNAISIIIPSCAIYYSFVCSGNFCRSFLIFGSIIILQYGFLFLFSDNPNAIRSSTIFFLLIDNIADVNSLFCSFLVLL